MLVNPSAVSIYTNGTGHLLLLLDAPKERGDEKRLRGQKRIGKLEQLRRSGFVAKVCKELDELDRQRYAPGYLLVGSFLSQPVYRCAWDTTPQYN